MENFRVQVFQSGSSNKFLLHKTDDVSLISIPSLFPSVLITLRFFLLQKMQEAFLDLNGVPTHVVSEGRWVESGLAADGGRDVVVVIPGNPGIPSFYNGFLKTLNSKLPMETPVWMVGHAGHVKPSETSLRTLPKYETNRELYNLNGQIKHKVMRLLSTAESKR